MPDMNSGKLHIDVYLTNLSIAYTNPAYIADQVFLPVPVDKRSDKYPIYNRSTFLRSSGKDAQGRPASIRRPKTRSTEIKWDISNQAFYCEQLAKNYPLGDAEVRYADAPLQLDVDTTMALNEQLRIDNEIAVAGKAGKRANYNASNKVQLTTGGAGTSWASSGSANSLPMSADIPNGKKAVFAGIIRPATHLLVNYNSALTLSQHPQYVDRIKYTSKEALTESGLLPVVEGLRVLEGNAQYITSVEGAATETFDYIWKDDQATPQDIALIFHRAASAAGLRTIGYGLTFEAPDDSLETVGFVVKRWREEWLDAERIEVRVTRDWRFTATDGSSNGDNSSGYATGGYLISGTTL